MWTALLAVPLALVNAVTYALTTTLYDPGKGCSTWFEGRSQAGIPPRPFIRLIRVAPLQHSDDNSRLEGHRPPTDFDHRATR